MKKCGYTGLPLIFAVLLFACNRPGRSEVQRQFHEANPSYSIVSVYPGEGDGAAAYFHIKYRKPSEGETHEDVWQYLKSPDGSWQINHKETLH